MARSAALYFLEKYRRRSANLSSGMATAIESRAFRRAGAFVDQVKRSRAQRVEP
jgi:hypothetical protein